jgi:hypothetical protein
MLQNRKEGRNNKTQTEKGGFKKIETYFFSDLSRPPEANQSTQPTSKMPRLCESCVIQKKSSDGCSCYRGYVYDAMETAMPETKVNRQTVFITLPNSKVRFQSTEMVRVFEPEEVGWIKFVTFPYEIISIDSWGTCESYNTNTGITKLWYTRPHIESVVTMNMKEKIGGFYFQFHKDGSITSKGPDGECYWGPIQMYEMHEPLITSSTRVRYIETPINLPQLHEETIQRLYEDDKEEKDEYEYGRRCGSKVGVESIQMYMDALKWRMKTLPGVRDNAKLRAEYEQMIETCEKDIERLRSK